LVHLQEGKQAGLDDGINTGFAQGKEAGFNEGVNTGFQQGKDAGFNQGIESGFQVCSNLTIPPRCFMLLSVNLI
jgi:flagellar assembly protein FliH